MLLLLFSLLPLLQSVLTADAQKLKYQPGWLRQALQPLRGGITAASLLPAGQTHSPREPWLRMGRLLPVTGRKECFET